MTARALLTVEVRTESGGRWVPVGQISPQDPPGSMSSDEPNRRRVYLFGWMPGVAAPGVWESVAGIDFDDQDLRMVTSAGLSRLSNLAAPFELTITRVGASRHMRFTIHEFAGHHGEVAQMMPSAPDSGLQNIRRLILTPMLDRSSSTTSAVEIPRRMLPHRAMPDRGHRWAPG